MNKLLALVGLFLFVAAAAEELPAMWGLGDPAYYELESETIGRSFNVWVSLPDDYDPESTRTYPTLYVLDGGGLFPLVRSYSSYLYLGDQFPAAIIVGVGYPGMTFEQGNFRSTDYTAPSDERDYWGGAAEFQEFLAATLMPMIEETYRSNPERRVVFGQSIGGQFVLFTAQTRPELFYGHIASNPALHRNLEFFLETTPEGEGRTRLLIASADGDDRRFKVPLNKWLDHWQSVEDPHWDLEVVNLEGHTHLSAPPEAIRHGMQWLFLQ